MLNYGKNKVKGANLVEYVLLASLIAVASITAMTTLGSNISSKFVYIANKLT